LRTKWIERYLDVDMTKTYNKIPGFGGTIPDIQYSILKEDMAKVKHGSKENLSDHQKNMILLPDDMIREADQEHPLIWSMSNIWQNQGRGKKPWEYNKVFLDGTVLPVSSVTNQRLGGHGILVELTFNDPNEPDSIDIWDFSHFQYPYLLRALQTWLLRDGYHEKHTGSLVERYHPEIPHHRDVCDSFIL
jgi:hypothetical protein